MSWLSDVYGCLEFTCKFESHFHILLIFVVSKIYVFWYTCLQFICLNKCTRRQKLNLHVKFTCLVDIWGMIWYDSITRLVDICDMAWHGSNNPASAWTCHGAASRSGKFWAYTYLRTRTCEHTCAHIRIHKHCIYVYNTHQYVCDCQRTMCQPKP